MENVLKYYAFAVIFNGVAVILIHRKNISLINHCIMTEKHYQNMLKQYYQI